MNHWRHMTKAIEIVNRILMLSLIALLGYIFAVSLCGCRVVTDAQTGQRTYALDEGVSAKIEAGAEVGAAVAPFLGGAGALIAAGLTGALAAWRKVKPTLTQAKTAEAQTHAVASALVTAIEDFKGKNPEVWTKLGTEISTQMTKQGIDPKIVENAVRGLRGLPPKA